MENNKADNSNDKKKRGNVKQVKIKLIQYN